MPLISVVMTSYNHQSYLSQAIDSVLRQTFKDIELIIVDDASSDSSPELIRQYQSADPRVRSIIHYQNMGIAHTTNDGFAAASGQFIAYMQSDDLWMPDKLEQQLQILSTDPDLIVWSDAVIIDGEGRDTGELFTEHYKAARRRKSGDIFLELVRGNFICLQSAVFSAQLARDIKFDPRCRYANDYKFVTELSRRRQFHFIARPLVRYRIHGRNTILQNRRRWERDSFFMNKYFLQNYRQHLPRSLQALLYYRLGRTLNRRNHPDIADRLLLKAMATWPRYRYCRKCLRRLLSRFKY